MPPVMPQGAGPVVPPPMEGRRAARPLVREQVTGAGRLLQVLTRDLFCFDPRDGKPDWALRMGMGLVAVMVVGVSAKLMDHPLGLFQLRDEWKDFISLSVNSLMYGVGMFSVYSIGRNRMSVSVLERLRKMADTIARPAVQALQQAGIRLPPLPREGPVPGIPLPDPELDDADQARARAMARARDMAVPPTAARELRAARARRRARARRAAQPDGPKPRQVVKDGRLIRETKKEAEERVKKEPAEDVDFMRAIGEAGILPIGGAALGGLVPPGAQVGPGAMQGLQRMQQAMAGQQLQQAQQALAQQQLVGLTPQQFADRQRQRDAMDNAMRDNPPADHGEVPVEDEVEDARDMVDGNLP